jgi:hypothetical protein
MDGPVTTEEILALPLFDQAQEEDFAIPRWMGRDELDNDVYIIGFGMFSKVCDRTMEDLFRIGGCAENNLLINALPAIGISARIGGGLSRGWGWVKIGRPLVAWGIRRSLQSLRDLVSNVKEVLRNKNG